MIKLNLNENFICRIWEEKSSYRDLKTCGGEIVEMLDYGIRNSDSGPDYKNAKVKIGGLIYSGSIEVHRSLDDWDQHNHKGNGKYNDVILHVVFYDDENNGNSKSPVVKKARSIPTIILSDFLTRSIREIWKDVINNPSEKFKLPCYNKNKNIAHSIKLELISGLSKLRHELKVDRIHERLAELTDDFSKKIFWEQILFEYVCEALGFSKNKEQFLKLSKKIEISKLKELNLTSLQLDSLLFGNAGFLKELRFKDKYIEELKSGWKGLREIFQSEPMDKSEWNFFRLRPSNFPTIRIAYASGLLHQILRNNFFKNVIRIFEESSNLFNDIEQIFKIIDPSPYWKNHYTFWKESKSVVSPIGAERIRDITVNVLLPLIFLYSVTFGKESLKNRADYFYRKEKQKSGKNEIIRVMERQLEVKVNTLSDEQGLIHLHNYYCVRGKCNECEIGKIVFKNDEVHEPLKIILY